MENIELKPVSICILCYNNAATIKEAVAWSKAQIGLDNEIIVSDDASTDNSWEVIQSIKGIKAIRQDKNLGCGENLNKITAAAKHDILIYLCGDDIFTDVFYAMKASYYFTINQKLAILTRPYYWFTNNPNRPVRYRPIKFSRNVYDMVKSFDQISGIALRKSMKLNDFSNEPFIEIASVCMPMCRKYQTIMLNHYVTAIRIMNNGSTSPRVFKKSPLLLWKSVLTEEPKAVKQLANEMVDLVQIKRFGGYKALFREIRVKLRLNPINALKPQFWAFSLFMIVAPKLILGKLVELYRRMPK